jgi:hypothetical protein
MLWTVGVSLCGAGLTCWRQLLTLFVHFHGIVTPFHAIFNGIKQDAIFF